MSAVLSKMGADLRRRRLQSLVIAVVIFLSSGAAALALNLLVETNAPYDRAFAQVNGAHLTMFFAADKVTAAQVARTAAAPGVTASVGPWAATHVTIAIAGKSGTTAVDASVVGRDHPDTAVDRLTLFDGRWAAAPGEVVLARSFADDLGRVVGDRVTTAPESGSVALNVVGIAASISGSVNAWVLPSQIASLVSPQTGLTYEMLYRVDPANTTADLQHAASAIEASLPDGAVAGANNYLDAKKNVDTTTAVMIPFLVAFSGFALLAAGLIIANIVAGVVIAGYREIGIMKAVGFAPAQVVLVLLGQVLLPAALGCALGVPAGMLLSQPFLQNTAHAFDLPTIANDSGAVVLTVIGTVATLTLLAGLYPAWQAGRMTAVGAITAGSAPAVSRSSALGRALAGLPLPRPLTLGLGNTTARPLRATLTLSSILLGAATVVFALTMHDALGQVAEGIFRDQFVQVQARRPLAQPGRAPLKGLARSGPVISDAKVLALLQADPGTARVVSIGQEDATVPGIADPLPFYAYRGAASWIGYPLIEGRWFTGPGEAVAPTRLLRQANLHLGDSFSARINGRFIPLRVVGEILDQTNGDLLLRGDWSTLTQADPRAEPAGYEIALQPGVDAERYAGRIEAQDPSGGLRVGPRQQAGKSLPFVLISAVIAGLALVLAAIAVAGVFNTVILDTREQVRDIAILKAVGMAPNQVVSMVVAAVAVLGLLAGGLGIPLGLLLQRNILSLMAEIATGTRLPAAFYDPQSPLLLPLLALVGVGVAALGAWLPARWAAYARVTEVLQAE